MRGPLLKGARPCMGCVLEITLVGIDARRGREVLDAAFDEAVRLEQRLSIFDPQSDVSRLNREAGYGPVHVSPDVLRLIDEAMRLSKVSGGAVDPTVAPLTRLWRNQDDRNGPPPAAEFSKALSKTGTTRVVVDHRAGTVAYQCPGVELEFGAMGKGYAVDRVVHLLSLYGVSSALVHFGSTTYALGRPPGKGAWRVGIRNPRDPNRLIEVVKLSDRAIATSANDQQAVILGGTPYGHILDPRSGWPADASLSASVVAGSALEADALSTAAFVLGPKPGVECLTRAGVQGLIVARDTRQLSMVETPGWKGLVVGQRTRGLVSRRRVLGGLLAMFAAMAIRPSLGFAVVYLSREEALRVLMPDADRFRDETIALTDAHRARMQTLMDGRIRDTEATFWVGEREGRVIGYATVLNVIGKEQPITFMVAVAPEGSVRGVQVLTYRESQGSEIRSKRFLDQFAGKTLAAPLKLGRDVHGISGASLSSRSTTYAVKKALALVAVVYGAGATAS
ncbi:MAG: FAD:protein FMN transferase [Nitrospirota bacterium]